VNGVIEKTKHKKGKNGGCVRLGTREDEDKGTEDQKTYQVNKPLGEVKLGLNTTKMSPRREKVCKTGMQVQHLVQESERGGDAKGEQVPEEV